jgi:alpha-N-acetylglucosamine transferase
MHNFPSKGQINESEADITGDIEKDLEEDEGFVPPEKHRYSNGILSRSEIKSVFLNHKKCSTRRAVLITSLAFLIGLLLVFIIRQMLARHSTSFETIDDPPIYMYDFPDLTKVSGTNKEAYGFLLCTRRDADHEQQRNYDGLLVALHRISQIQQDLPVKRDVLVFVCQHVPQEQYLTIKSLDVIVIPVRTLNPPVSVSYKRWRDNFTKLLFWKLIKWDRIVVMDIDIIFFKNFTSVWDEPAAQVRHLPPSMLPPNTTYFGYDIQSLYPYLHAAAIDSSVWGIWKVADKFNAGFYVMKPNLHLFDLFLDATLISSITFPEMEQSLLNFVLNRTYSPVPWTELHVSYNFFPDLNDRLDNVTVYHTKLWRNEREPKFQDLVDSWRESYKEITSKISTFPKLIDDVYTSSTSTSITIHNLQLNVGQGMLYGVASTNLTHIPSIEKIQAGQDISGSAAASVSSVQISTLSSDIKYEGLEEGKIYNVYYYAHITQSPNSYTPIYYIQSSTKA